MRPMPRWYYHHRFGLMIRECLFDRFGWMMISVYLTHSGRLYMHGGLPGSKILDPRWLSPPTGNGSSRRVRRCCRARWGGAARAGRGGAEATLLASTQLGLLQVDQHRLAPTRDAVHFLQCAPLRAKHVLVMECALTEEPIPLPTHHTHTHPAGCPSPAELHAMAAVDFLSAPADLPPSVSGHDEGQP